MAYDEYAAERIRTCLEERRIAYRELRMMGGWCVMVDEKMCLGVLTDKASGNPVLMVRVGQTVADEVLERPDVRATAIGDRPMKGYVFVMAEGFDAGADLERWIDLALAFNPEAKSSRSRRQ